MGGGVEQMRAGRVCDSWVLCIGYTSVVVECSDMEAFLSEFTSNVWTIMGQKSDTHPDPSPHTPISQQTSLKRDWARFLRAG